MKPISLLLFVLIALSCNNATNQESTTDSLDVAPDTTSSPMVIKPDTSLVATAGDNSMNSLDWAGTYKGVLPCADCEGILTTITLNQDKTYSIHTGYLGKKVEKQTQKQGKFDWSQDGSTITLQGISNGPSKYKVGENRLIQLDMKGELIKGELASKYVLSKQMGTDTTVIKADIKGSAWKLVEMLGKAIDTSVSRQEMFLQFEQDGKLVGHGGCNSLSGTYTLEGENRILFSKMISTRMACPAMQDESAFLQALSKSNTYIINGNTLQLTTGKMAPLLVFEKK